MLRGPRSANNPPGPTRLREPTLSEEITLLCDEIRALLDEPVAADAKSLARLEHTLTEGYARALALEAERLRLERRINAAAVEVGSSDGAGTEILASLAAQLSEVTDELTRLRGVLTALRARTAEIRELSPN